MRLLAEKLRAESNPVRLLLKPAAPLPLNAVNDTLLTVSTLNDGSWMKYRKTAGNGAGDLESTSAGTPGSIAWRGGFARQRDRW